MVPAEALSQGLPPWRHTLRLRPPPGDCGLPDLRPDRLPGMAMIDHAHYCEVLTDGLCTCGARQEPMLIFGITPASLYEEGQKIAADTLGQHHCTGSYSCPAQEHYPGCYSGDVCEDPDCEADKPHVRHS